MWRKQVGRKLAGSAAIVAVGVVFGAFAGASAGAFAGNPAPARDPPGAGDPQLWFDPAQLPETRGTVAHLLLTPQGDIDGLILDDGTEVRVSPRLSTQLAFAIRPGDPVSVRGLRARSAPVIDAVTITNQRNGTTIVDYSAGPGGGPPRGPPPEPGPHPPPPPPPPHAHGPHGPPPPLGGSPAELQPLSAEGHIQTALYGPHGEIHGAVLDDGTILYLPPDQAQRYEWLLQPGRHVVAAGYGTSGALGTAIDVAEIGPSWRLLTAVGPPGPHPHPHPHPHPPPPRPRP